MSKIRVSISKNTLIFPVLTLIFFFIFSPHVANAAISYVGGATIGTSGVSTVNLSLTALTGGSGSVPQPGDVVFILNTIGGTTDLNLGVTAPTGYTELFDLYGNDTYDVNFSLSYKVMGSTPDTSVTCTGTTGATAVTCLAYVWRGVDTSTPLDVTSTSATGIDLAIPDAPAITPVTQGAMVLAFGGSSGYDTAVTVPTGYSNGVHIAGTDTTNDAVSTAAAKLWSGSGAENPAVWGGWTTSTNNTWIAATVALRPDRKPVVNTNEATSVTYFSATFNGEATVLENDMSTELGRWTTRMAANNYSWWSVTYGNGMFVAVASDGSINRVMTSSDGVTWTVQSAAEANQWASVTYGNGMFVAVANTGTNRVMTSSDGVTWTARTAPSGNWFSVTYGNGMFVAVAYGGTNRVMTSSDGVTWTARTAPSGSWYSVTYGNGMFVAVAYGGTNRVMTSPDGITWTARTAAEANEWNSVTYGNGMFVAVANTGTNRVMTSSDGVTWTARTAPSGSWYSVTYGNGMFVAVADTGTNRVMVSTNGIAWVTQAVDEVSDWISVTYGNGMFVAVAQSGVNLVMTASFNLPTDHGFLWGTEPDLMGGDTATSSLGEIYNIKKFSFNANDLDYGTTYYYQSYVTTVYGAAYGEIKSFTTESAPTVGTINATDIDFKSATLTGNVLTFATTPSDWIVDYIDIKVNAWWYSVTYGNGMFVAVANTGTNRVMTSSDGVTWTARTAPSGSWFSVTYGNGKFVAVANSGTNRVMTSSDGVTWTARTAAEANAWQSVTYGNGMFVAVANSGTNRVMTSPDGITWTAQTAAEANSWWSVTYGNGMFVAVAYTGTNRVMTSPDGITWTARTAVAEANEWNSVTYGNGMFVAVAYTGTNRVMTSSDGVTWTARTAPLDRWYSVTYGNGMFVAVAGDDDGGVMTSSDGINWTYYNTPITDEWWQSVTYGNGIFVVVGESDTFSAMLVSLVSSTSDHGFIFGTESDLIGGDTATTSLGSFNEAGEFSFNANDLQLGTTYYYRAYANTIYGIGYGDIKSFTTEIPPPPEVNTNDVTDITGSSATLNGEVVSFDNEIGTDLGQWTASTVPEGNSWASVTYGNGMFVVVCVFDSSFNACNKIMTSTDGITWTARTAPEANEWNSVTYGNGMFVAVAGSGTNRVMTSTDGITWTARTAAEANEWISVTYGNGMFVAVASSGTNRVMTSSDGITWTARTAAEANWWTSVTYGNGMFVAVCRFDGSFSPCSKVMTSPDGITWTARTAAEASWWISVTYGNGMFVAVALDGTNRVMTASFEMAPTDHGFIFGTESDLIGGDTATTSLGSFDEVGEFSVNANDLQLGTTYYYRAYATTAYGTGYGDIKSFTTKGSAIVTTNDATDITENSATLNGEVVSFDNELGTELGEWTAQTAPTSAWYSVTYGNGMFVAVACGVAATACNTTAGGSRIMTSSDGITWTAHTAPEANYWRSITYGNGMFVAVASSGTNRVMTSTDGITWTARTAAEASSWWSVTYGNGMFVAVASNGTNRVMTSPDGITWTAQTAPVGYWYSVTYGNGMFVAVCRFDGSFSPCSKVMTSPDGITWTARTAAEANWWSSVTYGNGMFVAVASDGSINRVMTSPDGITWTVHTAPEANAWQSVTYGNGMFVAVASDGSINRVMTASFEMTPTDHGFIFGTESDLIGGDTATTSLGRFAETGEFNTFVDSLNSDTTYYYRAYATTAYGTGYGDIKSFTTKGPAIVTTNDVTDVTDSSATLNGEVVSFELGDATELGEWTARTSALNNGWYSVTYGNGMFVAVGASSVVMTSPDGITWTAQTAPEANIWYSVTYGNGMFVAVSWNGTNRVMTSPDGITWTARTAPEANSWYSVTYGNGMFVAVASSGTNRVMTSPDGIIWTAHTAAEASSWWSVTYGNGMFVVVAYSGTNRVMTSPDGIIWTAHTAAENNGWRSVTYGNGMFVAVSYDGANQVMTSPDGITWTARTVPEANHWNSVTYANGMFVAVANTGTNRVMTSPDGITWTAQTAPEANQWQSVTYANGMFVAVANSGTNRVMAASFEALTDHGFIFGTESDLIGGDTATTSLGRFDETGEFSTNANELHYDTTYYYRAYATTAYGTGYGDTKSFTTTFPVPEVVTNDASDITYQSATLSGEVVSFENELGTELGDWIARTVPEANAWQSVTYGNGMFVAVAVDGTNRVMTSPDGITWTARTAPEANWWSSVTYGNGMFVAVCFFNNSISPCSKVMTSPDGITWTVQTAAEANYWSSITYGNSIFVAVGSGVTGVMTSSDGITWTSQTSAEANQWRFVSYGNGMFVAVTDSGTNQVMTSPDGITWTARTAPEANWWTSVTYGNGMFVAVCHSDVNYEPCDKVMTSPDGITWTAQTAAEANDWRSVSYGNGMFVAVGYSGAVMTSPDGITWTAQTAAESNYWWSVTYGNGMFVAVCDSDINYEPCSKVMTVSFEAAPTDHGFIYGTEEDLDGGDIATISLGDFNSTGEFSTSTIGLAPDTTYYYRAYATTSYGTGYGDIKSFKTEEGLGVQTLGAVEVSTNSAKLQGEVYATAPEQLGEWTAQTAAEANFWQSVTYGNGMFVAVANSGTHRVMTSLDGITWTVQTAAEDNPWHSVTYGNGMFVAVANSGTYKVMTSEDGVTWVGHVVSNSLWNSVTYGNGLFVAVGYNAVMTSPDGIIWTAQTAAEANSWWSVTYGNGMFVAVSYDGTHRVMTSPDGIIWTAQTAAEANSWWSVTYGNDKFVAVACGVAVSGTCNTTAGGNRVMISSDGITWTGHVTPESNGWNSVTYGNGMFVAVANSGTHRVMTSPDGITWTAQTAAQSNSWTSVTYGNDEFVAVSVTGTRQVMVSLFEAKPLVEHGFIWGTNPNLVGGDTATTTLGTFSGLGIFDQRITGLNSDTTYYYRAYGFDGEMWSYGRIISFKAELFRGGGGFQIGPPPPKGDGDLGGGGGDGGGPITPPDDNQGPGTGSNPPNGEGNTGGGGGGGGPIIIWF